MDDSDPTRAARRQAVRRTSVDSDDPDALARLADALGPDLAQVLLFVDPDADFAALAAAAETRFGSAA